MNACHGMLGGVWAAGEIMLPGGERFTAPSEHPSGASEQLKLYRTYAALQPLENGATSGQNTLALALTSAGSPVVSNVNRPPSLPLR